MITENYYPRVLIFGPPFNDFSGGGITMTNLFKGWPKDKIAVAATGHVLQGVTRDVCDTYYLLGKDEQKWVFPFNLVQRNFPSGLISFNSKDAPTEFQHKANLRSVIVDKIFYPFIHWLGLFHWLSKTVFSKQFKRWLSEYNPEILYLQVTAREDVLFSIKLCDYLNLPSVIHNMDDWPSAISRDGILREYWKSRIDREFRLLLNRVDLHLSISKAMSSEYLRRYNMEFKAFHNPIEADAWIVCRKTNFKFNNNHVKILYSGRIGVGITDSLIEVADVIDAANETWGNIKLYIQSPSSDWEVRSRLQKNKCIVMNPVADRADLPVIFSKADILLIANDFDKKGINYLKYSMPTKVSEYMISATPILIYASIETAVSRFFIENDCGCCVTEQDPAKLISALKLLVDNEEYRGKIGLKAFTLAEELFDAKKVRNEFQQLLINLPKKENHV